MNTQRSDRLQDKRYTFRMASASAIYARRRSASPIPA